MKLKDDCLIEKKTISGVCNCNKKNIRIIPQNPHHDELKKKASREMNNSDAELILQQLDKNLAVIKKEILSLDVLSNVSDIKECNLNTLKERFKRSPSCKNSSSIFTRLNTNGGNKVFKLIDSFTDEIQSYYKQYDPKKGSQYLKKKDRNKVTCNLSDSIATQIANKAQLKALENIIKTIPLNNEDSILAQLKKYIISHKDTSAGEANRLINQNPHLFRLINDKKFTKEIRDFTPITRLLSDNITIKDNILRETIQKCNNTYDKALESLCSLDSDKSIVTDIKQIRKNITSKTKESSNYDKKIIKVQSIAHMCKKNKTPGVVDITAQIDDLNEMAKLPGKLSSQSAKSFKKDAYKAQHDVRVNICGLIPKQGDLLENIKKCDGDNSLKCSYLRSYKELIEENQPKANLKVATKINANGEKVEVKLSEEELQKKKTKINYDWNSISEKLLVPSKMIANFINADKPVEKKTNNKNPVSLKPQEENTNDHINKNISKSDNSDASHISGNNKNDSKSSAFKTNNRNIATSSDYNSSNTIQSANHVSNNNINTNPYYEKPKRDKNNIFRRMFKPKNKTNEKIDAIGKTVDNMKKGMQDFYNTQNNNNNTFDEYDYSSDITDTFLASTSGPSKSDFEIQSDIDWHTNQDRGLHSSGPPTKRRIKGKHKNKILPPYHLRQVNGDIKRIPGVEVGNISTSNIPGFIPKNGVHSEEMSEVALYIDPTEISSIDPKELITYDPSKGDVTEFANLVKSNDTFSINNNGDPEQRIIAIPNINGTYSFLVRTMQETSGGNLQEKYVPYDEAKFQSREFKKFCKSIKKAFESEFIHKLRGLAIENE